MDHERIRNWLALPAGPWPPDHYTLLGLPPGEGAAEEVERRVLERMEQVRRYQLPHPEPVTEAMNRLASALIELTDPAARRAYDADHGFSAPPPPSPPPAPPPAPAESAPPLATLIPTGTLVVPAVEEPVPELPLAEGPRRPSMRDRVEVARQRPVLAELVRLRRWRRGWEAVGEYLAEPDRPLRRTEAAVLAARLAELRELPPADAPLGTEIGQPGALVLALARQPLIAQMFRGLLPSQRAELARDWKAVRSLLRARQRLLRREVGRHRRRRWLVRGARRAVRLLADQPEWLLVAAAAGALVIGVTRTFR
jgi:hypothetical protein